ncbi:CPCC family cysteine-rich protein [Clostridium sp.]|jgi:hypothetical protein|nr:CPCC family cysteine-rich protein [Clostridium sp.]MCI1799568.1 hypothetical protein [Clostridium sp.]
MNRNKIKIFGGIVVEKKRWYPCCGALSLDEENSWDICGLCDWEDDPLQK